MKSRSAVENSNFSSDCWWVWRNDSFMKENQGKAEKEKFGA